MNSQRGKQAPNASRQNKSKKQRQPSKSQTNGRRNNNNNNNNNNNKKSGNRDYNNPVSAPVSISTTRLTKKPLYKNVSADSATIRHRELIMSVFGSTPFITNVIPINPGLTTFPWLQTQAQGWEKYRFNKLKFCYETRAPTSVQGSVMLSADYDAADSPPSTEQIMSNFYGTIEAAPWRDITFEADCKRIGTKYIRFGTLSPNLDIKTYDAMNFIMGTTDAATGGAAWGKLWVEYDVTFFIPQLNPLGSSTGSQLLTPGTGVAVGSLFGSVPLTQSTTGNIAFSYTGNTLTVSNAVVGVKYQILFASFGTLFTSYGITGFSGCNFLTQISSLVQVDPTNAVYAGVYTCTATNMTFTLSVLCATVNVTLGSLYTEPTVSLF
jgi:hypothetical protein